MCKGYQGEIVPDAVVPRRRQSQTEDVVLFFLRRFEESPGRSGQIHSGKIDVVAKAIQCRDVM